LLQRATSQRIQESRPLDKIQGKVQVHGIGRGERCRYERGWTFRVPLGRRLRRYRLFLRTAVEVIHGKEYVAEGVYAQKAIDEIGDPDQGKNGYPLQSSCERVVKMAWSNLAFDEFDADTSL
jgi:hypothetical protein